MKFLAWIAVGYVAIGVFRCFTAVKPTASQLLAAELSKPCNQLECVVKWPLWNISTCRWGL